jgi:hypothetical protein
MNKRFAPTLSLFLLLMAACTPSQIAVETAVPQTRAETPTSPPVSTPTSLPEPTATLVPLSELDLKQALVPTEDLPAGYLATKTKNSLPDLSVPEPLKLIWQQLERANEVAGGLRIYLYESKLDVEEAYKIELRENKSIADTSTPISDIGEKAEMSSFAVSGRKATDLVFARCYAVASIRMVDMPSKDDILMYAKRLDERLTSMVCR